jgi:hypothetical protein
VSGIVCESLREGIHEDGAYKLVEGVLNRVVIGLDDRRCACYVNVILP